MKIKIVCTNHNGSLVIASGEQLHWLRKGNWYELDEADLYCTGVGLADGPEHRFVFTIDTESGYNDD